MFVMTHLADPVFDEGCASSSSWVVFPSEHRSGDWFDHLRKERASSSLPSSCLAAVEASLGVDPLKTSSVVLMSWMLEMVLTCAVDVLLRLFAELGLWIEVYLLRESFSELDLWIEMYFSEG